MLNDLKINKLREILAYLIINVSGIKEEVVDRVLTHNTLPAIALQVFSSKDLSAILRDLEGTKISGTKNEKVQNIIDYYEMLSTPTISDPTDERARLFDFYEELAVRDYKTLRNNKVIDKDIDRKS